MKIKVSFNTNIYWAYVVRRQSGAFLKFRDLKQWPYMVLLCLLLGPGDFCCLIVTYLGFQCLKHLTWAHYAFCVMSQWFVKNLSQIWIKKFNAYNLCITNPALSIIFIYSMRLCVRENDTFYLYKRGQFCSNKLYNPLICQK